MFKDFPSLHPLMVHFPLVLILLAVPFQAAVVWKNWLQIRWATLFIMLAAFLSALLASTIFHAEPTNDAPKEALMMFEQHEKFAFITLWVSGITLLLKAVGDFYKIAGKSFDVLVLCTAIISATFLSVAGHHGARLTHIAGVGPMGRYLMKEDMGMKEDADMKNDSSMKMSGSMPTMINMPPMDDTGSMKSMNNKKDMNSMEIKSGMENMKSMDNNKTPPPMNDMKGMKGMGGRKKADNTNVKNEMQDMKGMDNKENMNSMDGMMEMDNKNVMKGMKDMNNMKSMKTSPIDTMQFEDNNPVRKKNKGKK